jgi:hypothetical protein
MIAMKRGLHELSEREKSQVQDRLTIPVGEFIALLVAALLTLGLLFGPPTLASVARNTALATIATFSSAVTQIGMIGSRMEARASEPTAGAAKAK